MKYMLLIYADRSTAPQYTPEQRQAAAQINSAYISAAQAAGALMPNDGFHIIANATTVRVRDGQTATSHGSAAATPEQLTGYIMLDCGSLDEAIDWAAKNPAAKYGSVEVRPLENNYVP